ncbi:cell envelope-like transcriptional attenuator [Thermoclostridium stercorarium subsp. stercorarium DSM 8532]|uniref:Cell envelope-like transcriptional attenuator n=1 Tax=Thermoclostridium stercorarium (strain ATCC 35414 / DSM 8532 / NCIMB 11754) TaxID=1121335 RepID=L7VS42_THES1|nr:LCP family protein [Thermoclostridium stercorarium]AGC69156.1 cell envelope-like transcriptional attenuator [Thermoclostridium stercorarium subsp. stercorarium DSM 8532]AGI40125.1 transcriptional attenuator [Thermoclostridium stercorarium subsp. stercorarium DSM 8532]
MTAKRFFLIFTIVMVTISGICIHAIISRARNELSKMREIQAKLPAENSGVTVTPTPTLPPLNNTGQSSKSGAKGRNLTNNQKYYTDVADPSNRNILLIGKDPTYSNFDVIIIASISEKDKTVKLIDIPRDIFIDYSPEVLKEFKEKAPDFYNEKGSRKINAAHAVGKMTGYSPANPRFLGKPGINFLTDLVYEIFHVEIHDYIAVETDGFREIVDYFGGVVVNVPVYMHYEDPSQDLYIHLEPGVQLLDGKNAEGFVRFRQGYNRNGEYFTYPRSKNVYLFLKAFFEQHFNLRNLSKIGKVYEIIKQNTETSVQDLSETYEYVVLASKIINEKYSIEHVNIETSGKKKFNGALYEILKTK